MDASLAMNRDLTLPAREFSSQCLGQAEISDLRCLFFPKKLWKIVESDHFKSISWNDHGDSVVIEEEFFQREILDRKGPTRIFETSSLKSFIRQLNIYGFSKVQIKSPSTPFHQGTKKIMIYQNSNFRRDCPFLIQRIKRRVGVRNSAPSSSVSSLPKRKKVWPPKRQLSFKQASTAHHDKEAVVKKGIKKVLKKSQHTQKKGDLDYTSPTSSLENSTSHSTQNLPQVHPGEVQNNIGVNPLIPQEPTMARDPPTICLLIPFYPDFTSLNAQVITLTSLYNPSFAMFMGTASRVPLAQPSVQVFLPSLAPFTTPLTASHQPSQ